MSEGGKISLRCFHFDTIIVIACLLLLLCCKIAIADTNTLQQSDSLNSTSRLVSSNNKFILGFFNITTTTTNTNKTYLGIWYEVDPSNPVWIANRDTPITNGSASLIFDSTGLLLINRTLGDPVQLCSPETNATASAAATANTTAVLLDDGNLVVRVVNSDGSVGRSLWESFDCPTDTLLPEMKLGVNHGTKRNWTLTSWLAEDEPSSGPFTLDWDPSALQLVVRRRGVDFWTSGVLQQNDTFPNLYDFLTGYYNMTYTSTTTSQSSEEFFNYSLSNNSLYQEDRTNIKWRMYYRGSLFFDEERSMELYAVCYGDSTNNGCAKRAQPECRSYSTNFTELSGYFTEESSYYNASMGPDDCRVRCWNDCDCQAYRKNDYLGCSTYSKSLLFRQDPSGNSPKFYVIQRPQNRAGSKNIVWIALSVSITLLFVFIIFIIFCLRWKRKGQAMRRRKEELLQLMTQSDTSHKANGLESDYNFAQNLKIFSFESIVEATNNFSPENKLGQGGFGPVYKGNLAEGTEIAVKRLSKNSGQGLVEFKNELILIAKLQHMNLVRLLGCSIQAEEMMLVYEYMPNKSLDFFLFDSSKRGMLDWRKRVEIIEGIAQGLLYLHQHSRLRIIHRDLKAGNILLDAEMNPKISDFGMARIFKQNDLIVNTNRIVGTYGYMSPEYAMEGIFSVKSDVFSFGVLTLEILSGRRNNSFYNINRPLNLVGYAWDLWQRGDGLELMDPSLSDSCSAEQFLRFLQVGLLCVEDSPSDRPTISEVISMITNENTHLPLVKKPAFMNLDRITKEDSQKNNALEDYSVNGMSISTMNAR